MEHHDELAEVAGPTLAGRSNCVADGKHTTAAAVVEIEIAMSGTCA